MSPSQNREGDESCLFEKSLCFYKHRDPLCTIDITAKCRLQACKCGTGKWLAQVWLHIPFSSTLNNLRTDSTPSFHLKTAEMHSLLPHHSLQMYLANFLLAFLLSLTLLLFRKNLDYGGLHLDCPLDCLCMDFSHSPFSQITLQGPSPLSRAMLRDESKTLPFHSSPLVLSYLTMALHWGYIKEKPIPWLLRMCSEG